MRQADHVAFRISDGRELFGKLLASRARRNVQRSSGESSQQGDANREIVEAFLAASRKGDFARLVALLDREASVHADAAAVAMGAAARNLSARAVAKTFSGRAQAAVLTLIDGRVGATWFDHGNPRVMFEFEREDGKITQIDLIADEEKLGQAEVTILKRSTSFK